MTDRLEWQITRREDRSAHGGDVDGVCISVADNRTVKMRMPRNSQPGQVGGARARNTSLVCKRMYIPAVGDLITYRLPRPAEDKGQVSAKEFA